MFLQQNIVKHSLILIIFYYFDFQKFITISQASETLKFMRLQQKSEEVRVCVQIWKLL